MNHPELLRVYRFDKKARYGVPADGGYVVGVLDGGYDCYLSAGVANEESFSAAFLKQHPNLNESNSFAFDGTIQAYPHQFTTNIAFVKKNIGATQDAKTTNLHHWANQYHAIFLKMDVEGGEYPWVRSMTDEQLRSFKQIVIEFHGITNDGWGQPYDVKRQCLEKLARTHYLIHAHGNNHGPVKNGIPDVIELTYVGKQYIENTPEWNTTPLPIKGLDYSNRGGANDMDLNHDPFVHKI